MRWIRIVAAVAVLAGCSPSPEEPPPAVGRVEVIWQQEDGDPVGESVLESGAVLLPDDAAWQAWVEALPPDMHEARAEELAKVTLEDSVKVVAVWGRCREYSSIRRAAPGELEFRITPIDDEPVVCAWSPRRVEVWTVDLTSAGADRDAIVLAH